MDRDQCQGQVWPGEGEKEANEEEEALVGRKTERKGVAGGRGKEEEEEGKTWEEQSSRKAYLGREHSLPPSLCTASGTIRIKPDQDAKVGIDPSSLLFFSPSEKPPFHLRWSLLFCLPLIKSAPGKGLN